MSEARKCDRCHGFYDIENEQQDRDTPYEFKGDYVNLHLWVARNGVQRNSESRWYDLCPKCMMELECWLNNNEFPNICEQCDYGYCSEKDKKKRWLENHKDEVKLSDPYEDGGL